MCVTTSQQKKLENYNLEAEIVVKVQRSNRKCRKITHMSRVESTLSAQQVAQITASGRQVVPERTKSSLFSNIYMYIHVEKSDTFC